MSENPRNPYLVGSARWQERQRRLDAEARERSQEFAQLTGRPAVMTEDQWETFHLQKAVLDQLPDEQSKILAIIMMNSGGAIRPDEAMVAAIISAVSLVRGRSPASSAPEERVHAGPVATAEAIAAAVAKTVGTAPPPLPPAGSLALRIVEAGEKAGRRK
jgi:hypothetical protein